MATRERLDQALVRRGLCESREKARRLILAGRVRVDSQRRDKPSHSVGPDACLEMDELPLYVSRGGFKLAGALDHFAIDPRGWVCLDIGASTGGFTDCLLKRGAERVHSFDVGTNQLAWKIRSDDRVRAREKFNARYLKPEDVGEPVRLIVIDVSFISLSLILPPLWSVLEPGGSVVCLIKPQFELAREEVGKGGIVKEEHLREKAVTRIRHCVEEEGRLWKGVVPSDIQGMEGNQEYLAWIQ
ncbi:MAG: TlyA family RNA methyltransferase [Verrucomicrobiota bacterium]